MMLNKRQYWGAVSWTYDIHSHSIFLYGQIFFRGKKKRMQAELLQHTRFKISH